MSLELAFRTNFDLFGWFIHQSHVWLSLFHLYQSHLLVVSFLLYATLLVVGVSVDANDGIPYKIWSTIATILAYFYPWGCIHVALNSNGDFDVFCNALFSLLGGITVNGELFVILTNRKRLRKIFQELGRVQKNYNIQKWSQSEVFTCNKMVLGVLTMHMLSFLSLYIFTMLQRIILSDSSKWSLPISDFYLINITRSPNYEIAWTYQVITASVVGSAYNATALLITVATVDLTVQFKILRYDIKEKFNKAIHGLIQDETEDCMKRNWLHLNAVVKEIVIRHLTLINLVEEVEAVFKYLVIMHAMGSMCSVCFGLYYSSILPPFSSTSMQAYFVVFIIILWLFVICYSGNELTVAAKSIDSACYDVDFPGTDLRFQKSLLMIIAQSQQEVKLTVGGFADLSMPVFAWIMKTTYTYFMILRQTSEVISQ